MSGEPVDGSGRDPHAAASGRDPLPAIAGGRLQIAVVGAASCDGELTRLAGAVGRQIASYGAVLLCGGRGGVMAAASEGARAAGGLVVGVLPGADARASAPNPHLDVALFTGLGQARNVVLTLSAHAVVAVGGGWGTLSEIALALKQRVPVVLLESWSLARPDGLADPLLRRAVSPADAVETAVRLGTKRREGKL